MTDATRARAAGAQRVCTYHFTGQPLPEPCDACERDVLRDRLRAVEGERDFFSGQNASAMETVGELSDRIELLESRHLVAKERIGVVERTWRESDRLLLNARARAVAINQLDKVKDFVARHGGDANTVVAISCLVDRCVADAMAQAVERDREAWGRDHPGCLDAIKKVQASTDAAAGAVKESEAARAWAEDRFLEEQRQHTQAVKERDEIIAGRADMLNTCQQTIREQAEEIARLRAMLDSPKGATNE